MNSSCLKNTFWATPRLAEPDGQPGLGHFGCHEVLVVGPGDKQLKNGEIRLEEQTVGGSSVDGSDTDSDKCWCCATLSNAFRVKGT